MSDYKDNALVAQSNQFVRETSNNLKANEIKIFDIFVSCIDTMHPKTEITIRKTELIKALNIGDENYVYTKQTLESLFKKTWRETNNKETIYHHFINKMIWKHDEDEINVIFDKDIIPMLIELKKNFLQYSVADLNELKSRYSMLMYKYILSYIRQYKTTELTLKIDEIKDFLNIKNKYNRFDLFDRKILKTIETEINLSGTLPYLLKYEKIKKGNKVHSIRFLVRPRTSNKEKSFGRIINKLIYEEMYNELIKGDTPLREIKERQADTILSEQKNKRKNA